MFKKFIAAALSSAFIISALASCSEQGAMDMNFIKEEAKAEYSAVVEGSALTFYVDGNVAIGGDGSSSTPFKTIPEAQAKIRELKNSSGLPAGGITVVVKDGEYRISEGFVFTEEDSGTEACPITYVSESEYGARITGSVILNVNDFEPINDAEKSRLMDKTAADNIVKVDLKKYGLTAEDWGEYLLSGSHCTAFWYDEFAESFASVGLDPANVSTSEISDFSAQELSLVPVAHESEIFIGDTALIGARWPNKGSFLYTGTDRVLDEGDPCYGNYSVRNPEGPTFSISGDIINHVSKWSSVEDVWIGGYLGVSWSGSRNKVEAIDFENETMKLKYVLFYLTLADGLDREWYFFNIFDELDTEGEFYLDRDNGILYVYKTENFYTDEIKISTLAEDILTLENVSNITFKGFNLGESRCNGFIGSGENITIENCKVENLRGGAINITGSKITVKNNELCNLGTYGVKLCGGELETLTHSENVVYNNYIHDWARIDTTYKSGIEVKGVGSLVSHNELCNSPHQAITYRGPNHIFEYNEVYNVLIETADCGAFYAGRNLVSYGCEIRYNYIHDIGTKEFKENGVNAHGIYWDDALGGQTAYGNVIVNTAGYGILMSTGRDLTVENNIIINSGKSPIHYSNATRLFTKSNFTQSYNSSWFDMATELGLYLGDVWYKAFPELQGIILVTPSFDGDLDDPMLSSNPANGTLKNNLIYLLNEPTPTVYHPKTGYAQNYLYKKIELYSEKSISDLDKFNDISNNPIIFNDFSDFTNWHNGDYTMAENAVGLELCQDFKAIPFNEIGRIK